MDSKRKLSTFKLPAFFFVVVCILVGAYQWDIMGAIQEIGAKPVDTRGKIAYLKDEGLWLSSPDGKDLEKIVSLKSKEGGSYPELQYLDSPLSWSPNGKYLAFMLYSGNIAKFPNYEPVRTIYVYDFNNRKLSKITSTVKSEINYFAIGDEPLVAWSPDSTKFAYFDEGHQIVMVDIPTFEKKIFAQSNDGENLQWSPDSNELLFSEDYDNIVLMNLKGSRRVFDASILRVQDNHFKSTQWGISSNQIIFKNDTKIYEFNPSISFPAEVVFENKNLSSFKFVRAKNGGFIVVELGEKNLTSTKLSWSSISLSGESIKDKLIPRNLNKYIHAPSFSPTGEEFVYTDLKPDERNSFDKEILHVKKDGTVLKIGENVGVPAWSPK